jgi:ABC-type antimicrobial peptide transport system permease subunit
MNIDSRLAALLAAVGIYGVLAAGVSARWREFGIRAAPGAQPRRLLADVLRQSLLIVGAALATGLAASWALGRVSQALLFGVSAQDPRCLAAAALLVVAACAAASLLAARRAACADPVQVLRSE